MSQFSGQLFPQIALLHLHNFCTKRANTLATILLNQIPLLPHPNSRVYNLIRPLFDDIPYQIVPIAPKLPNQHKKVAQLLGTQFQSDGKKQVLN